MIMLTSAYFFDTGISYYDQLTVVKVKCSLTRYPHNHIAGSGVGSSRSRVLKLTVGFPLIHRLKHFHKLLELLKLLKNR